MYSILFLGLQIIKNLCTVPLLGFSPNSVHSQTLAFNSGHFTGLSLKSTNLNSNFLASLPPQVFNSIISSLCLRDLHVAALAVDIVYYLTNLGSSLCNCLYNCFSTTEDHNCPLLLVLLIKMLNLEAQAMGSESLIRVRVMQSIGGTGSSSLVNIRPIVTKATHMDSTTSILTTVTDTFSHSNINNLSNTSSSLLISQPSTSLNIQTLQSSAFKDNLLVRNFFYFLNILIEFYVVK